MFIRVYDKALETTKRQNTNSDSKGRWFESFLAHQVKCPQTRLNERFAGILLYFYMLNINSKTVKSVKL